MKKIVVLLSGALMLSGCSSNTDTDSSLMTKAIPALESEVFKLQRETFKLQAQLANAKLIDFLENLSKNEASFSPASQGYTSISVGAANVVVSLLSIKKYANGYKVTFDVGNPTLMVFNNVKVIVHWGQPLVKSMNVLRWHNSLQTKEIELSKPLLPGFWNKVTVVLSPATPNETGYIGFSMRVGGVELYTHVHRK